MISSKGKHYYRTLLDSIQSLDSKQTNLSDSFQISLKILSMCFIVRSNCGSEVLSSLSSFLGRIILSEFHQKFEKVRSIAIEFVTHV